MNEEDIQNHSVENEQDINQIKKPDYLPEEYWNGESANLQKLTEDLRHNQKRVEDLRRKLSTPREPEPYETLFDGRDMDEVQKNGVLEYAKMARESGLSKEQAEKLYDKVNEKIRSNEQQYYENLVNQAKKELGSEYQTINDGLESFAKNQVSSGKWTEEDRAAFENMGITAREKRILANFIQNQKGMNLSGTLGNVDAEQSLEKEVYELNRTYQSLKKSGYSDDPRTNEIKLRLNKKMEEYNRMIDERVTNVL